MPVKLCLNMIVKNEEDNLPSCLKSVGHLLDAVAVIDTGSTDGTVRYLNSWMKEKGVPGEVISRPWTDNFGINRTEALRHAEDVCFRVSSGQGEIHKESPQTVPQLSTTIEEEEYNGSTFLSDQLSKYNKGEDTWYILLMDADNRVILNNGEEGYFILDKEKLTKDVYLADMRRNDNWIYSYKWLAKIDQGKRWIWKDPRHEYLTEEGDWISTYGQIKGCCILSGNTGAHSRDPNTYHKDALCFEKCLLHDPNNGRWQYYCGQSWMDAHEHVIARERFIRMIELEDSYCWSEEKYMACIYVAKITYMIDPQGPQRTHMMLDYFYQAFNINPQRKEAPYYIADYFRRENLYHVAWLFLKDYIDTPVPSGCFLIDENVSTWQYSEVAAVCAYHIGDKETYIRLCNRALNYPLIPSSEWKRINDELKKFGG